MGSEIENVAFTDCNALANEIMTDIKDVERMESMLDMELSSEDLFRIDCAIMSSLRNTQDFSRDLLERLEAGLFEEIAGKPPKTPPPNILEEVQKDVISDLTLPIQDFFNEMENYVVEALV